LSAININGNGEEPESGMLQNLHQQTRGVSKISDSKLESLLRRNI